MARSAITWPLWPSRWLPFLSASGQAASSLLPRPHSLNTSPRLKSHPPAPSLAQPPSASSLRGRACWRGLMMVPGVSSRPGAAQRVQQSAAVRHHAGRLRRGRGPHGVHVRAALPHPALRPRPIPHDGAHPPLPPGPQGPPHLPSLFCILLAGEVGASKR